MCYWMDEENRVSQIACSKKRKRLGEAGEAAVRDHLLKMKWQVLDSNWLDRSHTFELDLIALDPEGFLVFIEVKTRAQFSQQNQSQSLESALATMTKMKLKRLRLGARHFTLKNPQIKHRGWRFDLAVVSFSTYRAQTANKCSIIDAKRYQLAFFPNICN